MADRFRKGLMSGSAIVSAQTLAHRSPLSAAGELVCGAAINKRSPQPPYSLQPLRPQLDSPAPQAEPDRGADQAAQSGGRHQGQQPQSPLQTQLIRLLVQPLAILG